MQNNKLSTQHKKQNVVKWIIRIILGVEMVIIGIHFTKNMIKTSLSLLIER